MRRCIDSLLPGGEDVEILIVNDGSTDNTKDIAEEYRERFPSMVKVINKENGGHGSAVNAGIQNAAGLFYKVVDSDDWVNQSAYMQILSVLREIIRDGKSLDMLISNFVYEKEGEERKKVMKYHHALPKDQIFTWKDVKHFRVGQYILMHSVIYRTNLLRECGLQLPEHTFYVDNIFVSIYRYLPSAFARKIHGIAKKTITKSCPEPFIFVFNICPEFLLLLQILFQLRSNQQYGRDCSNNIKVVAHISLYLHIGMNPGHLLYIVIYHQLVYLNLLVDTSYHDLLIYRLVCSSYIITIEIHIQIIHGLHIWQWIEYKDVIHIKGMLRQL